jgi:hypothetical protein
MIDGVPVPDEGPSFEWLLMRMEETLLEIRIKLAIEKRNPALLDLAVDHMVQTWVKTVKDDGTGEELRKILKDLLCLMQ